MKRFAKNKGFTLLELLVAVSIFSGVIVLVVSSFAFAASYQRRVRINREVSQAARYSIDTISRDVMFSWNGPIKVNASEDVTYQGESVYNFAVLSGRGQSVAAKSGSVLVLRDSNNSTKRFYLANGRLAMDVRVPGNESQKELGIGRWEGPYFLTNENVEVTELSFRGVHNTKSANLMPSLEIRIDLKNSEDFFGNEIKIRITPRTSVSIRNDGRENL